VAEADVRTRIKNTVVINVGGPPAAGKTTTSRILAYILKKYDIKSYYTQLTGFHYLSFIFSKFICVIFKLLRKISLQAQILLRRHSRGASKIHPYDFIPFEYSKRLLKIIYVIEIISIYIKLLVLFVKIKVLKPKIIIVDEGFPNVIFNYILFFRTRNSSLYIKMIKHIVQQLIIFSRNFDVTVMVIYQPNIYDIFEKRVKRDPDIPKSVIMGTLYWYYALLPHIIALLKTVPYLKIVEVDNTKYCISYVLALISHYFKKYI